MADRREEIDISQYAVRRLTPGEIEERETLRHSQLVSGRPDALVSARPEPANYGSHDQQSLALYRLARQEGILIEGELPEDEQVFQFITGGATPGKGLRVREEDTGKLLEQARFIAGAQGITAILNVSTTLKKNLKGKLVTWRIQDPEYGPQSIALGSYLKSREE